MEDELFAVRIHEDNAGNEPKTPPGIAREYKIRRSPERTTYRLELSNGPRGKGNWWGVGRYVDGRRCDWALAPQLSEQVARDFLAAKQG